MLLRGLVESAAPTETISSVDLTEIPSEDEILQKVKGEIWELLDGPSIRLTVLCRALLGSEIGLGAATFSSGFVEDRGLRMGDYTLVSDVVSLSPFVDVRQAGGELILQVTAAALARSLAQGVEQAEILERLSLIAEPTEELSRVIRQASTVLGRAEMIQAQGFLWIDDAEVRHMLSSRRQTADMFVNPSPLGGLLIVPGVELDKLAQRLRALGVELRVEGQAYLARISQAPASRRTGVPSQAPASRRGGGSASQAPASRRSSGTSALMQVAVPESKRRPSETAAAGPASRRTRKKASSHE